MTEQELKDLLMGSILALGYSFVSLEKYKDLLKTDNTWQDAVDKTTIKIKEMIMDINATINNDFTIRDKALSDDPNALPSNLSG